MIQMNVASAMQPAIIALAEQASISSLLGLVYVYCIAWRLMAELYQKSDYSGSNHYAGLRELSTINNDRSDYNDKARHAAKSRNYQEDTERL